MKSKVIYTVPAKVIHLCQAEDIKRSFTNAKWMKSKVIYTVPAKVIHSCQAEDIKGHLLMPNEWN